MIMLLQLSTLFESRAVEFEKCEENMGVFTIFLINTELIN